MNVPWDGLKIYATSTTPTATPMTTPQNSKNCIFPTLILRWCVWCLWKGIVRGYMREWFYCWRTALIKGGTSEIGTFKAWQPYISLPNWINWHYQFVTLSLKHFTSSQLDGYMSSLYLTEEFILYHLLEHLISRTFHWHWLSTYISSHFPGSLWQRFPHCHT